MSEYLRRIELALTAEKEENQALRAERDRLREALEQLAILGNEPYYGNSDGNRIAQKALGIDPSAYMTKPGAMTPAGQREAAREKPEELGQNQKLRRKLRRKTVIESSS